MLNKVILMGRLTADPELRRTQSNTAVTSQVYMHLFDDTHQEVVDLVGQAITRAT